jgi:hypothetical protein
MASIELARKASMAKMHGLKPAKRPAAKTVTIDDMVRSPRAFLVAHTGAVIPQSRNHYRPMQVISGLVLMISVELLWHNIWQSSFCSSWREWSYVEGDF